MPVASLDLVEAASRVDQPPVAVGDREVVDRVVLVGDLADQLLGDVLVA